MARQRNKLLVGSVVEQRMARLAEYKRNVAKGIRLAGSDIDSVLLNAYKDSVNTTVEVDDSTV